MNARNLLSLSGMLLVLGVAGYYWGLGQRGPAAMGEEAERLPDYEAEGIELWQTDEKGLLARHMTAPSAVHYATPDEAILNAPNMVIYRGGMPAWRVTAAHGFSQDTTKEVRLEDHVRGQRIEADAAPVVIETPVLWIYPGQQTLNTTAEVTIQSPKGSIEAQGLDADMKDSTLNLHSNVRGTYAAAKQP